MQQPAAPSAAASSSAPSGLGTASTAPPPPPPSPSSQGAPVPLIAPLTPQSPPYHRYSHEQRLFGFTPESMAAPVPLLPQPVLNINGSEPAAAAATRIREYQAEWTLDPPPINWECVKKEDHGFCLRAMEAMVKLHDDINDAVFETAVVPQYCERPFVPSDKSYPPGQQQPQLIYYEFHAFGMKKFVSLEDMMKLKKFHRRILNVGWNPCSQSQNRQYTGALVMLVSSIEYDGQREIAERTIPSMPSIQERPTAFPVTPAGSPLAMHAASPAPPQYAGHQQAAPYYPPQQQQNGEGSPNKKRGLSLASILDMI